MIADFFFVLIFVPNRDGPKKTWLSLTEVKFGKMEPIFPVEKGMAKKLFCASILDVTFNKCYQP